MTVIMSWIILVMAGLCEVGFAFCLGKTKGLAGLPYWEWMAGFAFFYVLSAVLLSKATQTLPIGTAYPVWTGIGAVGSVLLGIFVFHEPATFWRIFFITTLIVSIIGLKMLASK
jgi:quaternary ammonium compound-resistance protein SugE